MIVSLLIRQHFQPLTRQLSRFLNAAEAPWVWGAESGEVADWPNPLRFRRELASGGRTFTPKAATPHNDATRRCKAPLPPAPWRPFMNMKYHLSSHPRRSLPFMTPPSLPNHYPPINLLQSLSIENSYLSCLGIVLKYPKRAPAEMPLHTTIFQDVKTF